MPPSRPRITFVHRGGRREVDSEGSVLDAARTAGLPLASACRGVGVCDSCLVVVVDGAQNLTAPTEHETQARLGGGERLACQAYIVGQVTVTAAYW